MCFQDDAPDTKKDFTGDPVQDRSLPGEWCSSFHLSSYGPPVLFFSFTKKETPAGVHLIATDHVISFSRTLLVRGQTAGISSHCTVSADTVGSVFAGRLRLFGVHIHFWPPAEMIRWNRGRWAFWQRLQRWPDTSGSGQFRPVCPRPGLWWLFTGT